MKMNTNFILQGNMRKLQLSGILVLLSLGLVSSTSLGSSLSQTSKDIIAEACKANGEYRTTGILGLYKDIVQYLEGQLPKAGSKKDKKDPWIRTDFPKLIKAIDRLQKTNYRYMKSTVLKDSQHKKAQNSDAALLWEKDLKIQELTDLISKRDELIQKKDAELSGSKKTISERDHDKKKLQETLNLKEGVINAHLREIKGKDGKLKKFAADLQKTNLEMEKAIAQKSQTIESIKRKLQTSTQENNKLREEMVTSAKFGADLSKLVEKAKRDAKSVAATLEGIPLITFGSNLIADKSHRQNMARSKGNLAIKNGPLNRIEH